MGRLLCRLGHHRWKGQGLQRPFGWLYVCVRCRQVARWEQETPAPAPYCCEHAGGAHEPDGGACLIDGCRCDRLAATTAPAPALPTVEALAHIDPVYRDVTCSICGDASEDVDRCVGCDAVRHLWTPDPAAVGGRRWTGDDPFPHEPSCPWTSLSATPAPAPEATVEALREALDAYPIEEA